MAMNTPGEREADERTAKGQAWMIGGIVAALAIAMVVIVLLYSSGRGRGGEGVGSPLAEGDPPPAEVVWRQLDGDPVAAHDSDEVLAHLAAQVSLDVVAGLQLDGELAVAEHVDDLARYRDGVFARSGRRAEGRSWHVVLLTLSVVNRRVRRPDGGRGPRELRTCRSQR
jgi:hypothetical protein